MRSPDPTPDDYRFWIVEHIRYADLDVLGHVNNKSFLTYAEGVRAAFLLQTGLWTPTGVEQNVLVSMSIDYRRELHYPGEVRVGLRLQEIGRSSYTVAIGLFDGNDCAATASATLVRIDMQTRRPIAIDADTRAVLERYR